MTRDEIYDTLVDILSESFELDRGEITREAKLYEELGLDSIDAVDIFVQLREVTGRRPDPSEARKVRTVDELITFVEHELEAKRLGLPEPAFQGPPDPKAMVADEPPANETAPEEKKKAAGE